MRPRAAAVECERAEAARATTVHERAEAEGEEEGRKGMERGRCQAGCADERAETRRGMPLALVIARYFAYVIVALGAVWVTALACFSIAIGQGAVYAADYGPSHDDEAAAVLRAAPAFDASLVPTAYHYLLVSGDGALLETDLPADRAQQALEVAAEEFAPWGGIADAAAAPVTAGTGGVTYSAFALADGTICVLTSTYMPQFVSRELHDALPNPQNLLLVVGCAGSVMAVALIARRASRVIARKMAPLTDAAERIARGELDFAVGASNVRQVNDVLGAMERMRASLAESLEARWRAEQQQRDQVAALAHDLKTPLSVVRANADYVAEELGGEASGGGGAGGLGAPSGAASAERDDAEVAAAAADIARAAQQLDAHVQLLIDASRGTASGSKHAMGAGELAAEVKRQAEAVARAAGVGFAATCAPDVATARLECDEEALARAVMNAVANAADHAHGEVRLAFALERAAQGGAATAAALARGDVLAITVDDDGPGFTPEALVHGCERFFRGDAARSSAGANGQAAGTSASHYGIGLFSASEIVAAHGGTLELSNRSDDAGRIAGARVTVRIPVTR